MEIVTIGEYWDVVLNTRSAPLVALIFRLPPRFWREITLIQKRMKSVDPNQLYATPSTFHITVKGLGVLDERMSEERLESILSRVTSIISPFEPFEVSLRGLEVFPTCIYIKVEDRLSKLQAINKAIVRELGDDIEVSRYDGDEYIPHVTIATFANKKVVPLLDLIRSSEMRNKEFGTCSVFELEAIEARMHLALGPEETQEGAYPFLRALPLGRTQRRNRPVFHP
jgi:2'-5' RNA ligase